MDKHRLILNFCCDKGYRLRLISLMHMYMDGLGMKECVSPWYLRRRPSIKKNIH
jgi:hypothetical protein